MNKHGLTKENLVSTLPKALQTDPSVVALTEALVVVLADRPKEIERLKIYPVIDTLEEPLLDILAHDFKVDWWDQEYTLLEKRRTLKGSWLVHKRMGTKAAIEEAVSAIFPGTQALAWFSYGGEPYHFRLNIELGDASFTTKKQERVLRLAQYYKSLRDVIDAIEYTVTLGSIQEYLGPLKFQRFVVCASVFNGTQPGSIRLNGEKMLDGSWTLTHMGYSPILQRFAVRAGLNHVEELVSHIHKRVGEEVQEVLHPPKLARLEQKAGVQREVAPVAMKGLHVQTGLTYREKVTGIMAEDKRWYLNGVYPLSGCRTLDSMIKKEEI